MARTCVFCGCMSLYIPTSRSTGTSQRPTECCTAPRTALSFPIYRFGLASTFTLPTVAYFTLIYCRVTGWSITAAVRIDLRIPASAHGHEGNLLLRSLIEGHLAVSTAISVGGIFILRLLTPPSCSLLARQFHRWGGSIRTRGLVPGARTMEATIST
jgi:hypothetical protein